MIQNNLITTCRRAESEGDIGIITAELNSDGYGLTQLRPQTPGIILEFGCNIALTAITTAKLHPGVTIYCFEPFPETCTYALHNIRSNGLEDRIKLICCGVSWYTKPVTFFYHPSFPGGSGAGADGRGKGDGITVNIVNVGAIVREILEAHPNERVQFMKVDCEGCEGIVAPTLEHFMQYEPRLNAKSSGEFHPWHFQGQNYQEGRSLLPGWNEQMVIRSVCNSPNRHRDYEHCNENRHRIREFVRSASVPFEVRSKKFFKRVFKKSTIADCASRDTSPTVQSSSCRNVPKANFKVCGEAMEKREQDYLLRKMEKVGETLNNPYPGGHAGMGLIVGCGVGTSAIQMANMLTNTTVFCFEEDSEKCALANYNVKSNGLEGQVAVLCCGLTDDTLEPEDRYHQSTAIAVRAILDRFHASQFGSLETVFFDCDGCESVVLGMLERMMNANLRLHTPNIFGIKGHQQKGLLPGWTKEMAEDLLCRKYKFYNC